MIAKESIGIVFQIHRKKQKKTLKEVSEQMRCSISRLSKFENGQQFFDKSEIVRLYECIGLNFVIDPRIHEELLRLIRNIVSSIIQEGYTLNLSYVIDKIERMDFFDEYYFAIDLMKMIKSIYQDNDCYESKKYKDYLKQYVDYMPEAFLMLLYKCFGLVEENNGNWDSALNYFELASQYEKKDVHRALIDYHRGRAYCYCGKENKSLKCLKSAQKTFEEHFYFYRVLLCAIQRGIVNFNQSNYEKAILLFEDLWDTVNRYSNYNHLKDCVLKNLLWSYLCNRKNAKLLSLIKSVSDDLRKTFHYNLCSCICYYREDDIKKSKNALAKAKHNMREQNERVVYYLRAYECLLLDDNYYRFKEMMNLAIEECKRVKDMLFLSYFYEELVYLSRSYKVEKDELYYSRLLITHKNS